MNPRPLHIAVKVLSEYQPCDVSESGIWMGNKAIFLSSLRSLFSTDAIPLWCLCQRGRWRQTRGICGRGGAFSPSQSRTGVIWHTINIFMNTIKVLTSSCMRFRVMRKIYFRLEEIEPYFIVFHSKMSSVPLQSFPESTVDSVFCGFSTVTGALFLERHLTVDFLWQCWSVSLLVDLSVSRSTILVSTEIPQQLWDGL